MANVGECSDYISPGKSDISPGKYRCGKAHSAKDNQNDSVLWRMNRVRTCQNNLRKRNEIF